jgi:hypothetical protein
MKKLSLLLVGAAVISLLAASCNTKTQTSVTPVPSNEEQTPAAPAVATKTYTSKSLGVQFDYPADYTIQERDGAITLLDAQHYENVDDLGPYISISISSETVDSAAKTLHKLKQGGDLAVYSDDIKQYGPNQVREISFHKDLGSHGTEALLATAKGTVHFLGVGVLSDSLPTIITNFKLTK